MQLSIFSTGATGPPRSGARVGVGMLMVLWFYGFTLVCFMVLWGGGNRYVEGEPRTFGYLMLYDAFPLLTIGYLMFYETFPLLTIGYLMFYDYLSSK